MNIELKPIAQKKLEQMGATVHGVLVKNEAGAWAAVSDAGRVMWLDGFEGQAARAQGGQGADLCRCIGSGNGCCCDMCDPSLDQAARAQSGEAKQESLQSELTTAKAEVERLRGRVGELESAAAWCVSESGDMQSVMALSRTISGGTSAAWLLRKQAEAVESARCRAKIKLIGRNPTAKKVFDLLNQEAGCLRQQADEIEKAGGGHG